MGLSRFSYLRVMSRSATLRTPSDVEARSAGKELGARYVMEGSLRHAGSKLRIAVQLVDTNSGAHLWAENYERAFHPESLFELQDDIAPRVVSTCGDSFGVLARSISDAVRGKASGQLTPYEALMRGFGYHHRLTPEEHAEARELLERAVEQAPGNADCWAMLSWVYSHEYGHGFNPRPGSLDRSLAASRRAVELAPSNHLAQQALAVALFFRKEKASCLNAAERALALNPWDGSNEAIFLITFTGDWERGCTLIKRSMELNPHHPGWYWLVLSVNEYRKSNYRGAVDAAVRASAPNIHWTNFLRAAACGQLGESEAAQKALHQLLAIRPDYAAEAREDLGKWLESELVEHIIDGLRKAGLEIPQNQKQALSGPVPAAQSIAVLPFANLSADPEQDYFSDGLAEEIINLLAQIPGLKVIARTSAFAFRGKEQDIRSIAETLGVSTILEGSVRRSGSRIRVTAQLINAADGSHLWSERYDRELSDIFAVQDEISGAIAKALRVKLSPEAAPQRYTPKLPAYEAYLKAKYQQAKVTPESMELARRFYEQASQLDPGFAMAHVGLGFYWYNLAHFGRHFAHECVPAARAEAQRALQIDPSLPEAHALLGYLAAMYDMDWAAAEKYFDSPMAKQVGFGLLRPLYGWVQFWQGNVAPAIRLAQRAIEEDPLEIWARMNLHAYLQAAGRDAEALAQLKKVLELDENQVVALVSMAMIYADEGDLSEALKIARRTYAIGPWYPDAIGVLAGLTRRNGDEVESSLMQALGSGEAPGDARAHALFHLLCGEIDQGADWAEKAIQQHDSAMILYLRSVVSKGLRASHRWPKIANMINLPA
jgi:serine/threonine-protein kinase